MTVVVEGLTLGATNLAAFLPMQETHVDGTEAAAALVVPAAARHVIGGPARDACKYRWAIRVAAGVLIDFLACHLLNCFHSTSPLKRSINHVPEGIRCIQLTLPLINVEEQIDVLHNLIEKWHFWCHSPPLLETHRDAGANQPPGTC
jgi:hypothetical protein